MTPTNPPELAPLFNFPALYQVLQNLVSVYGTGTSGPLGALVLALFVASLGWVWIKTKFDTWAFWELFLRLIITVCGIAAWTPLFWSVDGALNHIASLFGYADPLHQIANVLYDPFTNLTAATFSLMALGFGPLMICLGQILFAIAAGLYNLNVVGAYFTTLLLYLLGPIFLATFVFEPLHDIWMKYVRFYLTIKAWVLIQNALLYMIDAAVGNSLTTVFGQVASPILTVTYLMFLIIALGSCLPIASRLVGGAQPLFTGSIVPRAAGAAATGALVVAGMAVGGPAGGAVGGAAGKTASSAAPTREG